MKRTVAILIGLLLTINIFGQIELEVKEVLSKKDFGSFRNYTDTLSYKERRIQAHWTILRDLTNEYKEGIFYLIKSVPEIKNPGISSVYTFRLRLITKNKEIIYYDLCEKHNRKIKKESVPFYDTIAYYKNDSSFNLLRKSFNSTFQAELNESELFLESVVFGQDCGFIGEDPYEKTIIDGFVVNKDKNSLLKWLKSTNFEKQLYAVDGLFQLKEQGLSYSENELEIIKNVLKKKGTVYFCQGCAYSWKEEEIVTYKYKF